MKIVNKPTKSTECQVLSELFGGNRHNQLKRVYYDDPTAYRCSYCKVTYDAELLGNNTCPECQRKMKHTKMWSEYCPACQEIIKERE